MSLFMVHPLYHSVFPGLVHKENPAFDAGFSDTFKNLSIILR